MPSAAPQLRVSEVRDVVARTAEPPETATPTDACAGQVGLEVEVFPDGPHTAVTRALQPVDWPGGSRLTYEPGGQVELSGPCLPDAATACRAMARDLATLTTTLADHGIGVTATGMHPGPSRPRVLDHPRYAAMEAYFDTGGPEGRQMMRDTAALQLNVDHGGAGRWRLLHALGPVLAAAFANAPGDGWRSRRGRVWLALDRTRCAPVGGTSPAAWVDYAMAARVMMIRVSEHEFAAVDRPMTLADWATHGHPLGWPTADDVAYHLTTLFPPVRPRGWLELRFLDALPTPWWHAAAVVVSTLVDDADCAAIAAHACKGTAGLWPEAARHGVSHPVLGDAAVACLGAAASASGDPVVGDFFERYTERRRCPADDALVGAWD